jgi:hypothetical protein
MGGRRPTSVSSILGPNRSPGLERELKQALRREDAEKIARVSVSLASGAATAEEVSRYFEPFLPFIKNQLERAGPIDLRYEVRAEWSRIKSEQGIEVRQPVSDAIVQAVIDFLRTRGLGR